MKLCDRDPNRKTHKGEVSEEIRNSCNKVECTLYNGETCECWMEYPKDVPYHDKETVIKVNGPRDDNISAVYYLLTALIMGIPGFIWLLINVFWPWLKQTIGP